MSFLIKLQPNLSLFWQNGFFFHIWTLQATLTGLKVSSLACKCVFYRPGNNAKGGPHGTEFWRSRNVKMKYTNR